MTLLIAFVVLSIAVSFMCSILEAALLSMTPSYISQQKVDNPKLYEKLKKLKDRIDQPIAAILTLNTVAHTVGATGVGAQVILLFGDGHVITASVVMTILILVLSEILPKTIGHRYWRNIVPYMPYFLNSMIFILKPFISINNQIMRLFGEKEESHNIRQEIKSMSLLGRELNELDEDEQRIICNTLELHNTKVKSIMTPRIVCQSVKPDCSMSDFLEIAKTSQHSRYPVIDDNENPLGVVFRHDLLSAEEGKTVSDIMKPANVVSDIMNIEQLMDNMLKAQHHMSVVYDEYGSWQGIVTMEDILEAIIGKPIMDETDNIPNLRRFAKKRWEHKQKNM